MRELDRALFPRRAPLARARRGSPRARRSSTAASPRWSPPACRRRRRSRRARARAGARSLVAAAARDARHPGALGRARRALPRVLQEQPARPLHGRRLDQEERPLRRRRPPHPPREQPARGHPLARARRERLRSDHLVAGGRGGPLAVHARGRAHLRAHRRSLDRRAPRSRALHRSPPRATSPTCTALRELGARLRRLQHGLRRPARVDPQVQHQRLLGALAPRGRACRSRRRSTCRRSSRWPSSRGTAAVFGLDDVELDPAVSFDKIAVRSGVSLQSVALAAGTSTDKVAELNPQLLASRAPPALPGPTGTRAGPCASRRARRPRPPRACPSSPTPRWAVWLARPSRATK